MKTRCNNFQFSLFFKAPVFMLLIIALSKEVGLYTEAQRVASE